MDSLLDMRSAVQSDLTLSGSSVLFPPATVDLALNRAYRKIVAMHLWPETEDAQKTSTISGQEYYDYPTNWRSNSVWRLEIDGERWGNDPDGSPMTFADYLIWKEDNTTSTSKKWSNQQRRLFVYPVPTTNGTNNVAIWGQKTVSKMVVDADVTIFSYSTPEINEAIVLEAGAILKSKGEVQQVTNTQLLSVEAVQIVSQSWQHILSQQAKYEKSQPMFDVPDYYGQNGITSVKDKIGNF
jgi:hypothetical protein